MSHLKTSQHHVKQSQDVKNMDAIFDCIPDFVPVSKDQSNIIDSGGIKLITMYLPPVVRIREWTLLFSIDIHGTSMHTFYSKLKERDNSVILIQTGDDEVFGSYTNYEWRMSNQFYGSGESCFLFSLEQLTNKTGHRMCSNIHVYDPTYNNNRYQNSDEKSITLGAGEKGRSALWINTTEFKHGYTSLNDTFTNPQLTKDPDFRIKRFEVWGFNYF